ncbi:MAG: SDR family NAD(P)-dependent oxidoreductase, partial [Desulfobacula sp.]
MNDFFSLHGKTALVTGAGRGLGREIAMGLARSGASLILADAVLPEETEKLIRDQ